MPVRLRWFFRLLIPTGMVLWGVRELYFICDAGLVWHGYHSAIAFFLALIGLSWLFDDVRERPGKKPN